jgi:hypothetical protein
MLRSSQQEQEHGPDDAVLLHHTRTATNRRAGPRDVDQVHAGREAHGEHVTITTVSAIISIGGPQRGISADDA